MPLLDAGGREIPKADIDRVRASAHSERGLGQTYEGARHGGTFMGAWPARLQSANRDWIPARNTVVARARDLRRNDPVAQSAEERKKNAAVGKGWRFISKPNARALGLDPMVARKLGQQITTELHLYFNSYDFQSDAERQKTFGQNLRVMAAHLFTDGEFLAKVEYDTSVKTRYRTRLRLIDPDRLSNPAGQLDTDMLVAGVQKDGNGAVQGYWIRERHAFDLGISSKDYTWAYYPRYSTALNRPNILHGFDANRAGQTRGISRFAASLKKFRGFDQFEDATIETAAAQALIMGFVQSSAGPDAVSESFSAKDMMAYDDGRQDFYGDHPVKMGGVSLPVLPFGDELKLATASKDVAQFDDFTRAIIRLIAASLGITYEELSMDYSQTNYSSARAAMIHAWADTVAFMGTLEAQGARPLVVAVLEEAFDQGYIDLPAGAPDFYDAIDAYCAGRFIGPPRGYVDPVKEILAAAARIEAGISTLERECAEQGEDMEDVLEQQAFESQLKKELGLEATVAAEDQAMQDTKNPGAAAKNPTDPAGQPAEGEPPAPAPATPQQAKSILGRVKAFGRSALSQLAVIANSADHEASLDARPGK